MNQYFQLDKKIIVVEDGNYDKEEFEQLINKELIKAKSLKEICYVFNFELITPIKLEI